MEILACTDCQSSFFTVVRLGALRTEYLCRGTAESDVSVACAWMRDGIQIDWVRWGPDKVESLDGQRGDVRCTALRRR